MPHFFRDFILSIMAQILIILIILHIPILKETTEVGYDIVIGKVMSLAHRLALWSVISLLSSSCCAFQLILNMFSVGCRIEFKDGSTSSFFYGICHDKSVLAVGIYSEGGAVSTSNSIFSANTFANIFA